MSGVELDSATAARSVGTLLGIWAHPDDEAYLSSGLMSLVRRAGGRVVVVTATRGEHGTPDPARWPPERLAVRRERELEDSLRIVGVREHRWLEHRDGTLGDVPVSVGSAELLPIIEDVRPDTIVTFGPDGMTGHDDHRAISAWVTHAWRHHGRRGELWYATLTPEFQAAWGQLNDQVGLWFDDSVPPVTSRTDLAAEVRLTPRASHRKHRALRAHASQTRPLEALVGSERYRAWWATETFVAADRARLPRLAEGRVLRPAAG